MQIFNPINMTLHKTIIASLILLIGFSSCKKETLEDKVFQINDVTLYPNASAKLKEKTDSQWVAVLYTNLFQQALSAGEIYRAGECITSVGDKEIAREVIISTFMNYTSPSPVIPNDAAMRADIDNFVLETYERFLIRRPTEGEKEYFRNEIQNNPTRSAEIVLFSFALCNEYLFY